MEHGQSLFGVAVAAMLVLHRLRLPAFGGLLVGGALAGLGGFGILTGVEDIREVAEISVILLLFTIGLEFSLARLRYIRRPVLIGGTLQVGVTLAAAFIVLVMLGDSITRALLFGAVAALSSTAIVLRMLSDCGELDARMAG